MQGKSLVNVSLPIKVFDSKSFLQKCALFMKTAPFFLEKASLIPQNTPEQVLERFKLVVAFAVSQRQFAVQMKKPFNPILGETYQARLGRYQVALE
jgi:hypothetical protein